MILAGKAVADLRLTAPLYRFSSGSVEHKAPCKDREFHGTAKEAPVPWTAGLLAMLGTMRRKLACLWMAW